MKLDLRQSVLISAFLGVLYLLPAINEWIQVGMPSDNVLLISTPIWLTFFYVGPFWLYYFCQRQEPFRRWHITFRGAVFVGFMWAGIYLVNYFHKWFFPHFDILSFERFFSAVLWGGFFFVLWESLILYQRYNREKALREQMQLLHLNNQLNPHFLFNSLNTISALIFENQEKADDVLHKFADILRYAIDVKDALIDLKTEIEISKFYLDVEKARFGDNLQVTWEIATDLEGINVPPLLMQPIIENSLKHASIRPLKIKISLYKKQERLCIDIQDNGQGYPTDILDDLNRGLGLKLIHERLAILKLGNLNLRNVNGALSQLSLESSC